MKQLSNQQVHQVNGGMIPVERDMTRHLFTRTSQPTSNGRLPSSNPYSGIVTLDISRTQDSIRNRLL